MILSYLKMNFKNILLPGCPGQPVVSLPLFKSDVE